MERLRFRDRPQRIAIRELDQDFNPFEGLKNINELRRDEGLSMRASRPFYLEGIGIGKVVLYDFASAIVTFVPNMKVLDFSGKQASTVSFNHGGLAIISIRIDLNTNGIPPNISCAISAKGLEMKADYHHHADTNSIEFSDFMHEHQGKLVVPVSPTSLAQLSLRFLDRSLIENKLLVKK